MTSPALALTFDDGPHPEWTPRLLDLLAQRGLKATFFVIGKACEKSPDTLRRAFAEGHEIANHTWTHPHLTQLSTEDALEELERTSAIIHDLTGQRPPLMRPPYLDTNDALEKLIGERCAMKVIGANVDSRDWSGHAAQFTEQNLLAGASAGAILLCHDPQPTTTEAMPRVLDALVARGFEFVIVSELLAREGSDAPA